MLSNSKLFSVGNFDFKLSHLLVIGILSLSFSVSFLARSQPADFGFQATDIQAIRVNSAEQSLGMIMNVFSDEPGPARDIVCLNAGAAIYVAGISDSLMSGVAVAQKQIASGKATRVLEKLIQFTNAR